MRFDKERFFEDLQEKIPEVYGNDKVQELIKLVIDKHYKKVENDNIEIFGRFKRFTRSS